VGGGRLTVKTETCSSDIYVYFNVFFKFTKVHLLVSELYIYQNARCNSNKRLYIVFKLYKDRY
jgi:hypothetical protein